MSTSHLLIINPCSGGGLASQEWPQTERRLRAILPPFHAAFTESVGDATRLAAEAVGRYEVVVAVGGDGTTNEVVNGLIGQDGAVPSGVALGVIPAGTGSDFLRSFGAVATYLWAIAVVMLHYRDQPVSFSIDGGPAETVILSNAWIANGSYSGAGIRSVPSARPDDGLLDVVRIVHTGLLQRLRGLGKLRSGAFVHLPHVDCRTARHMEVTAESRVPVETDGEPMGIVSATFDLLPARLPVIC